MKLRVCFLTTLLAITAAWAADEDITIIKSFVPGNTKPIWVNISGLTGEAAQVLQFDLYVQGYNFTNADNAQYLIAGSNNGSLSARATDKYSGQLLVNKVYNGGALRRLTHAFVDDFTKARSGVPICQTRIAYKNDLGRAGEIVVSDFDGHNASIVTKDNALVAAPSWAHGRMGLYYTSYRLNHPDVYYHNLSDGSRKIVARHGGSNLSPAPSPDGSKVAMILSKDGWTDLYVADADGSNVRRLTKSREDESSPCWSPDSKWICFATRIQGTRTLCKIPAAGGEPQRIPTSGVLNPTEPDWSPDGEWIAFTSLMGNFEICVVPAKGGRATQLVAGEDPSWSPNSRTLVYARREGSRRVLSLLDVPTKQSKDVSRISGSSGSNSQPSWAK